MLYHLISKEYMNLEKQIHSLEQKISLLPNGTLICIKNKKYYKWYLKDNSQLTYLPKKERNLAEQLALKKYYSAQLNDLLHERSALRMYLNHHKKDHNAASGLLETKEYSTLLKTHFHSFSQELQEWVDAPYEKNKQHPESLIHKSISGNIVRSKSETLIDMILFTNHIPYRYENPLILNDHVIYPDFTIRHPSTGKIIYWEHFGMMDNPNYKKITSSKLDLYIANGIIPSIDLITTYETEEHPLDSDTIMNIIEKNFK